MQHRILFIFIDGIGIGLPGPSNPFSFLALPAFETLACGQSWTSASDRVNDPYSRFHGIDATLGMPGLPQSGTGQATLFTGFNCAASAGRHFGPFPHSSSRDIIKQHNLFAQVIGLGHTVAFANAYPPVFFEHSLRRNRWSVTTRSCLDAGVEIRTLDHLSRREGVAADVTGERLRAGLGLPVSAVQESEAADTLVSIAAKHRFTLFEYFHTDKAGHARSADEAEKCLLSLDRFLQRIYNTISGTDITLVLTSDHGNLEDLSIKTHTRNPVPLAVFGPGAASFQDVGSIQDVASRVMHAISNTE